MRRHRLLTHSLFLLLLLIQPGFNRIQQYHLTPTATPITQPPFPIPEEAMLPISKFASRPQLTAKALIVIDKESGALLYAKNPDQQLYPASLTKMMTAMVALDTYPMDRVIMINEESEAIGTTIKLQKGERITVEQLLRGLLIASGNDAAFALANAYPAGYQGFIEKMNEKAQSLHMNNTTFKNASGVEQEGHLTTVRDIATLTKEAMKLSFFRDTVSRQSMTLHDIDGRFTHEVKTTNKLLGVVEGIEGVKTGFTTEAGECLITQTTRNNHTIITAMLGSQDRFGESARLISWAYATHEWKFYRFSDWLGTAAAGTYP